MHSQLLSSVKEPEQTLFSPAQALWKHHRMIAANRDRLKQLYEAVNDPNSLTRYQWAHLYAAMLEFKPDLVIELGRHYGNSTCVFTEVANYLGQCRVVSLCRSNFWAEVTKPLIDAIVSPDWFAPLDVRVTDILQTDLEALLVGSQRVLVFWDAHSYAVAEFVLGYLMPQLQNRQHLVLMHDITDLRYNSGQEDYRGHPLWQRGNDDAHTNHGTRVVLGYLSSAVEQSISIVDFTSRNHLMLHSADHSLHTELEPEQVTTLRQHLEPDFFSLNGHWFWFSLNEKAQGKPVYFPKFTPPPAVSQPNTTGSDRPTEADLLKAQVDHLQTVIRAMESSKLWKLRTIWFKFKQALGLT